MLSNSGYFEKKYALPSLIRKQPLEKSPKINKRTPMFIPKSRVKSVITNNHTLKRLKNNKSGKEIRNNENKIE